MKPTKKEKKEPMIKCPHPSSFMLLPWHREARENRSEMQVYQCGRRTGKTAFCVEEALCKARIGQRVMFFVPFRGQIKMIYRPRFKAYLRKGEKISRYENGMFEVTCWRGGKVRVMESWESLIMDDLSYKTRVLWVSTPHKFNATIKIIPTWKAGLVSEKEWGDLKGTLGHDYKPEWEAKI